MIHHITLTGEDPGGEERTELVRRIRGAGHIYHSSTCSKTTLLIASPQAIETRTTKWKKALDLLDEGKPIRVRSYPELKRMLAWA